MPTTTGLAHYENCWGVTMMRAIGLLAAFALVTGTLAAAANGAELQVLSAGAMRAALQGLAPAFEAASGHNLKIEYATAVVIEQKVAAGRPDRCGGEKGSHKAGHTLSRSVQKGPPECQ